VLCKQHFWKRQDVSVAKLTNYVTSYLCSKGREKPSILACEALLYSKGVVKEAKNIQCYA